MNSLCKGVLASVPLIALMGCAEMRTLELPEFASRFVSTLGEPFGSGSGASGSEHAPTQLPEEDAVKSHPAPGNVAAVIGEPDKRAEPVVVEARASGASSPNSLLASQNGSLRPHTMALAHANYPADRFPSPELTSPKLTSATDSGPLGQKIATGVVIGTLAGGLVGATAIAACLGSGPFAPLACPPAIGIVAGGAVFGGVTAATDGSTGGRYSYSAVPGHWPDVDLAQEALSGAVRVTLESSGDFKPVVLKQAIGPTSPDARPRYSAVLTKGADRLLETRVLRVGFIGDGGGEEGLALALTARARVIQIADAAELAVADFGVIGDAYPVTQWRSMNQEEFDTELRRGYNKLAERIVNNLLLHYIPAQWRYRERGPKEGKHSKTMNMLSAAWNSVTGQRSTATASGAGTDELKPYGHLIALRALQPAPPAWSLRMCAPWSEGCGRTPAKRGFSKVDSSQPLLSWEQFPRKEDRAWDYDNEFKRITDISYQLRIYAAPEKINGDWVAAGLPVVDIRQLDSTSYRPQAPFESCAHYFWTVRAHFRLGGEIRATQWSGTYEGLPELSQALHQSGLIQEDDRPDLTSGPDMQRLHVPSSYYFAFKTPCPE